MYNLDSQPMNPLPYKALFIEIYDSHLSICYITALSSCTDGVGDITFTYIGIEGVSVETYC